ncbi:MAG: polysaccharide deacetylase family protein [Alicyclobacillus sp.]|nr:polysaccharide deacetylase family protein [Alicyclobacillus sp.]
MGRRLHVSRRRCTSCVRLLFFSLLTFLFASACAPTADNSHRLATDEPSAPPPVPTAETAPVANSVVRSGEDQATATGTSTQQPTPPDLWLSNPDHYAPGPDRDTQWDVSVPILEYHEVNYVPGDEATLRPGQLAEELAWLHEHGFHPINFGQLYAAMYRGYSLPDRPVLLTFDDGYESVYFKAFPLLQQYQYPATLFIVADFTHDQPDRDQPFPTLTRTELQAMEASGLVDVEAHSLTHRDLATLPLAEQEREIVGSARFLESIVHHPVRYFCYPDGSYSDQTLQLLRQAGYWLAVTQHQGYANPSQGRWTLHRITVLASTTLAEFAQKLQASLTPPPPQPQATVQHLIDQAMQEFAQHQYNQAVVIANQALAHDPTAARAYAVRGIAQAYAGQYSQALADLTHALALRPDDGYIHFNHALALELYGHFPEALRAYQSALEAPVQGWWSPWCDYGIASIYGRRGDATQAAHYLLAASILDPAVLQEARHETDFDPVRQAPVFANLLR